MLSCTVEPFMCLDLDTLMLIVLVFCLCGRQCLLVDPSEREERVTEGKMVIGMNKHREICMLQVTGQMLLQQDQVSPGLGWVSTH